MPILAFTCDAVHDLFLLYALQIFKAILPSQLKYLLRYGTQDNTRNFVRKTHDRVARYLELFIFPIYLFEVNVMTQDILHI